MTTTKGFTLVELLIVIGILAVLATATALILNPAELLAQGRDSTRISDAGTIVSVVSLYMADVGTLPVSLDRCTVRFDTSNANCKGGVGGTGTVSVVRTATTAGWMGVAFNNIASGSPLPSLPIDPSQTNGGTQATNYRYSFATSSDGKAFEFNTHMESAKYKAGGTGDVETDTKDGGNNGTCYEVGNDQGLDLISAHC